MVILRLEVIDEGINVFVFIFVVDSGWGWFGGRSIRSRDVFLVVGVFFVEVVRFDVGI